MLPAGDGTTTIEVDEKLAERLLELSRRGRTSVSETIQKLVDVCGGAVSTSGATASVTRVESVEVPVNYEGPLVQWDLPSGTITYRSTKRRYFMVNGRSWTMLEEALFLNLMKGAAQMIFEMGRAYGNAVALDLTEALEDLRKANVYIEQMAALTGLGRLSIEGDIEKGRKLKVRVDNCVFCAKGGSVSQGRDSCYFLMGVTKGMVDTIYDWPHTVYEGKCCLRGDEYCEIVVNSKEGLEEKGKAWGFKVLFPQNASNAPGA